MFLGSDFSICFIGAKIGKIAVSRPFLEKNHLILSVKLTVAKAHFDS
jgi:hypothetical protein